MNCSHQVAHKMVLHQICRTARFLITSFLLGSTAAVLAQERVATGVFTAEQLRNGERAYQASCGGCHGMDLRRTDPEAPDLTGAAFRFGWQGKALSERFEKIRGSMPKAAPRSLDDQSYLDILGYLLQANGVSAVSGGDVVLRPAPGLLQSLRIELPLNAQSGNPAAGSGRRR